MAAMAAMAATEATAALAIKLLSVRKLKAQSLKLTVWVLLVLQEQEVIPETVVREVVVKVINMVTMVQAVRKARMVPMVKTVPCLNKVF